MRLIDADALKKEIADLVVGGEEHIKEVGEGNDWVHGIHSAYREIDNAPTVEERPKGKWIAISERLPVYRDWYLGTFRESDTGFIGLLFICDYVGKVTKGTTKEGWILRGFTDIDNACDYYKSLECIAWQPLPEPYKEGGENNL